MKLIIPIVSLILWHNVHAGRLVYERGPDGIGKAYEYLFNRNPRATDEFASSLNQMQMISRITTGISMQYGLSNGTITFDDLIPELLHFGTITPTQISTITTDKLTDIVDGINGLQGKLDSSSEQLEEQLVMFASVYGKTKGVDSKMIISSDKKYETELDTMIKSRKSVAWSAIEKTFSDDVNSFLGHMQDLAKEATPIEAATSFKQLASIIDNFKKESLDSFASYTKLGALKSIESSFPSLQSVYTAVLEFSKYKDSLSNSHLPQVQENINKLNALAEKMKPEAPMISQLHELFMSRKLKYSDNFKIISGLLNGISDIQVIFTDLKNEWVNKTVDGQAYNLGKALNQLKTLGNNAQQVDLSIVPVEEKILKDVSNLYQKISSLKDLTEVVKPLIGTVTGIEIPESTINTPATDVIGQLIDKMKLLSSKLAAVEVLVQLSKTLRSAENMGKLDKMIKITTATEGKLELFQNSQEFKDIYKLILPAREAAKIMKEAPTVMETVTAIQTSFGNLTTFVNDLKSFLDEIKFLENIKGIDSLKPVIEIIRAYRDPKVFEKVDLSTLISHLPKLKSTLKTLGDYIKGIKTSKHMETEALSTFTNISLGSKVLGMATRGITNMQMMSSQKVDLKIVKEVKALIDEELKKHQLEPADVKNLNSLDGLEDELNRIKKAISDFKKSVKPVKSFKLSNYSGFFQAAKKVPGIKINLPAIIDSVEKLKDRLSTRKRRSASASQIDTLLSLLRSLQIYDSAKFLKAFDDSAKSLRALDTSFTAYSNAMSKIQGQKGSQSPGSSGSSPAKELSFLEKSSPWSYIIIGVASFLLVAVAVGVIVYFFWKRKPALKDIDFANLNTQSGDQEIDNSAFIPTIAAVRKYLSDRLYRVQSTGKRLENDFGASYYDIIYANKIKALAKNTPAVSDLVKNHSKDHRVEVPLLEETRVVLKDYGKRFADDYIHASYVTCQNGLKLILTQSPQSLTVNPAKPKNLKYALKKPCSSTIEKFWWMARQEKATAIVMMCNFVEQNPADGQAFVASSEYFPLKKNEKCEFEGGSVKCTNYEREYIGIITRKLTLTFDDGEEFKITHHQVLDWNGLNALEEHRGAGLAAMFLMKYETTAIVHCVDGVSRSAVLAGMIIGFQKIVETGGDMQVADLIDDLRKQRAMAITSGLELAFVDAGIFLCFKRMMDFDEFPQDLQQMLKDAVQYYKLIAGYQVQQRDNYFKKLDKMGKKPGKEQGKKAENSQESAMKNATMPAAKEKSLDEAPPGKI